MQPLSDAQAERLIKLYNSGEREILAEINRWLLKNPNSYTSNWNKTVLARVQQIRDELLAGSRTWCESAIPDSYMKGVAWADADPLAGTQALAGFGGIHQQAVQVLAENTYSRFISVDQFVGRQVGDLYRSITMEAIKGPVLGYQTTRQAAKQIRERLAEKGITGFRDRAGREWSLSRYAKVAAQESTNQTFRQGTINRFQERGHDLVRLSSHAGSCKLCAPFQGKTFSLSGNDKEFPPLDEAIAGGVFHVSCLHIISLAPEEKDRYIASLEEK